MKFSKISKAKSFFGFAFFVCGNFMNQAVVILVYRLLRRTLVKSNSDQQKNNLCQIT